MLAAFPRFFPCLDSSRRIACSCIVRTGNRVRSLPENGDEELSISDGSLTSTERWSTPFFGV
jgi:hypothetical protein